MHGGKSLLGNKVTKQIITITVVITTTKETYCRQWEPANVSGNASLKK